MTNMNTQRLKCERSVDRTTVFRPFGILRTAGLLFLVLFAFSFILPMTVSAQIMSLEIEFDGNDPITGTPYILVKDAGEEANVLTIKSDTMGTAALTLLNIAPGTQGAVAMPANIVFEGEVTDLSFETEVDVRGTGHSGIDKVAIQATHNLGGTAQSVEFYVVNRSSDTDLDGLTDGTELDYEDENGNRLNRFHLDTDRDGMDDQYEYTYRTEANGGSGLHPANASENGNDQGYNGDNDFMAQSKISSGVGDITNFHVAVYLQSANELYAGATAFNPRTAWGGADDARETADYTATNEYLGADRLVRYQYDVTTYTTIVCIVTNTISFDQTNPLEWDTDGDTMPDGWELYVGLNPNYDGDKNVDPDSDGMDNWEEWGNFRDANGNSGAMNSWSNKLWPTDPGVVQRTFAWQDVWFDNLDDGIYDSATDTNVWNGNWDLLHTNMSLQVTNGMVGRKGPIIYPTYIAELPEYTVIFDPAGGTNDTGSAWADDGDGVFSTNALFVGYPADIPSLIMPPVEGDIGTGDNLYYYHNDYHPKDTDFDGLADSTVTGGGEKGAKSNPTSMDTENDYMPDGWERYAHAEILEDDRTADPDGDGLANNLEYWVGAVYEWMHIDPTWPDFYRIATRVPMSWDTVKGGSTGMRSKIPYYIPPHFADCPSFNVANGQKAETAAGYAMYHTTRVDDPDSDYDGMDDYWEIFHGLNPIKGSRDLMMEPIVNTGGDRLLGEGDQTGIFDADTNTVGVFEIGDSLTGVAFTSINDLIAHLEDNIFGYDIAVYTEVGPFNFGLELMDPDGDGLPNLEEYSYEGTNNNTTGRKFYHTDPTPYMRTFWYPNANEFSFPLMNYTFDNGWGSWNWDHDGGFPFIFETTEGFDTDNDVVGDLAEVDDQIPALLGGSDPINSKNPARNRCAIFDAANEDFLRTADAWGAAIANQMNQFTVEAWVYVDDYTLTSTNYVIIDRAFVVPDAFGGDIICSGYRLGIRPDGLPYVMYNGRGSYQEYNSVAGPASIVQTGVWTHIAGAYDGSNLNLFVNGNLAHATPTTELPVNGYNQDPVHFSILGSTSIGARDNTTTASDHIFYNAAVEGTNYTLGMVDFFDGAIDEVRVWEGARSALYIQELMRYRVERGAINNNAELTHYISFDECSDVDVNWPGGVDEPVVPANMAALQGADLPLHQTIYEWSIMPQRSTVYTGSVAQPYNYILYAEDLTAHIQRVPAWDDYYHLITTTNSDGTNTVSTYSYPSDYRNAMNPYMMRDNVVRLNIARPSMDFLFFNGAQADGDLLAASSWLYTDGPDPDAVDSDGDGLPDWWENTFGLDPQSSEGVNGASGDPDGDGLFNYAEYQGYGYGLNPRAHDSDNDGVNDYNDDADGDQLASGAEQDTYRTNPGNPDTDDDGKDDGYEVTHNYSARYPRDPLVPHSLLCGGTAIVMPEPRKVSYEDVVDKQRFENLGQWVVAAQAQPIGPQTASLVTRMTDIGQVMFDLRLNANVPSIRFQTYDGIMHAVSAPFAISTTEFTPLMGQWDPDARTLSLYVSNELVAAGSFNGISCRGAGSTTVGDNYIGYLDDVFVGPEVLGETPPAPEYVLIIDVSGSMTLENRMEDAKLAAIDAINLMPEGSVMAIVSFESTALIEQDFTDDKAQLKRIVDSLQASGGTDYRDPLLKVIELWESRVLRGARIGIMISDGEPYTEPSASELQAVAGLSVVINTVGFGSTILAGDTAPLERIAAATGGNFYAAPDGDDLAEILGALVNVEELDEYGFYPFDDNATVADDFTHLLDSAYSMTNVTFNAATYATELTEFNYIFADFDDEMPDWWLDWFLYGSQDIEDDDDPDGDGVSNLNEWRLSMLASELGTSAYSPMQADSNGDGTGDGYEDADGDSLVNLVENDLYSSRPDMLDTDDDALNDNWEVSDATDPADSISPFVERTLEFGASGGDGLVRVTDKIRGLNTERLSATNWTIECSVRPSSVPPAGVDQALIVRRLDRNGLVNYELGLRNVGGKATPYLRYNSELDTNVVELASNREIPLGEWTHLAGRLDDGMLTLLVDGLQVRSKNVMFASATGRGDLLFGDGGFAGELKEMRIWRVGRSDTDIDDFRNRTLLFDSSAASPGLLRVDGGSGHLRESAALGSKLDQLTTWSLECWVKTLDSDGMFISRVNTSNSEDEYHDFNYYLGVQDGKLVGKFTIQYTLVTQDDEGGTASETTFNDVINSILGVMPINDGEWHHVAYTRNSVTAALYLDGRLESTQDGYLVPLVEEGSLSDDSMRILDGPIEIGRTLEGDLDEIRIWNDVRTSTEINTFMKENLYGTESGLITYFNFDNQQGEYAEDRAAVRDQSVEFGLYVPNATHVSTDDQPPMPNFDPLRVYAFTTLLAYFPGVDGGLTVEDFLYPLQGDYAGMFDGDVQFTVSPVVLEDSDGDGLPDSWETAHGLNPGSDVGADGAWGDPDNDGLNNRGEYLADTDPQNFDSDGDGFGDYDSRAAPNARSWGELYSDGDGMDDEWEAKYPTVLSPLEYDAEEDPDGDGWSNFAEFMFEGFIDSSNYVNQTDPSSIFSHPVPQIPMDFTLGDGMPTEGKLRVLVYSSADMNGEPDAQFVYDAEGDHYDVFTFDWTEEWGHIREGDAWFFAYGDADSDGQCDTGESAALAKYNPVKVSWGNTPRLVFGMTRYPPAFGRFSWGEQASAEGEQTRAATSFTPDYYTVTIQNMSLAGGPEIIRRNIDASRTFFHEGDYLAEGVTSLKSGHYKWQAWAHNPVMNNLELVEEGSFVVANPAQQSTPVTMDPNGSQIVYARNEFQWMMDASATEFNLQISPDRNFSTILFETVQPSLFREDDGSYKYYLPIYAGQGSFVNRPYYWRVRSINGNTWSGWGEQAFTLNMYESPQGAYTISGELMYFGKITNMNLIVQAYYDRGFSGQPEAQITMTSPGAFQLMGLRAGSYNVMAFFDQNYNGVQDEWESSGFVKNPTVYATDYEPKALTVPGNITGQRILLRDHDTDRDRIPDAWEWYYFGNLTSAFGTGDYDGDGVSDYDEIIIYNTNPNDSSSKPATQPDLVVSPAQLIVYALPGQPATANISIRNDGHGAVTYTLDADETWISFMPDNGYSTGQENTHIVNFSSMLAVGDYTAHIIVNAGDSSEMQQAIAVEYRVRNTVPEGQLRVDLSPADAVAKGARWRVGSGAWLMSGTLIDLTEGFYTISFKDVAGYPTPANRMLQIFEGQLTTSLGRYGSRVPLDFDGDGKSDLSVFYPHTGDAACYSRPSAGGSPVVHMWGDVDVPVPADYTGDGVTDMTFYYPEAGMWVILNANGTQRASRQFGWGQAVPVPGDYDGDAIEDMAIYWPQKGTWYILQSSMNAVRQVGWGWGVTVPVPGDYDGDGKTDIGVYWHETGMWYILRSSDGAGMAQSWGWHEAVPVQGDYDGDGKTDISVYWPVTGNWYINYSSNGGIATPNWGWYASIPVPADYDGDGKTDIAVYWPVTGNWYIQYSSGGGETANWGWYGTEPTLNQYQINQLMGLYY